MLETYRAEFLRGWIVLARYPVESLLGVVALALIFLGLLTGANYLAGGTGDFGSRLNVVVVNYLVWVTITWLFVGPSAQVAEDAHTGVLEQLLIAVPRFERLAVARLVCGLIQHLTLVACIALIVLLTTDASIHLSWQALIAILVLLPGAAGLGLMAAAYALLIKKTGAVQSLGQFSLLLLTSMPFAAMGGAWPIVGVLLPLNTAAQLSKDVLALGHTLDDQALRLAALNSCFYFIFGFMAVRLAVRYIKTRGWTSNH